MARRALWHLRTGGFPQLAEHLRRVARGGSQPAIPGTGGALFDASGSTPRFREFPLPHAQTRRAVRVGVIADDFTRMALGYEWNAVSLDPKRWPSQLEGLDLVFVESAWHGNGDAWQYQITGTKAPSPALRALLSECHQRAIPTVFWNKEDPAHFEDFIDAAALCDVVFTTDVNCINTYREKLGHDRVEALPFAVQEALTNPVVRWRGQHERDVAFAGTWFAHKFADRRAQMRLLFDATRRVEGVGFEIFSRFKGGDERYQFPQPYSEHVVGSLNYAQMLSAYRAYKVFLNVNTVTDSPTMFSRRLLEITACGTPVVTTPTPAIRDFLGEGVAEVTTVDEAEASIRALTSDPYQAQRLVHLGQRELWAHHTYSHRVDTVLRATGLERYCQAVEASVSVIMATRRPEQLEHALAQVGQQRGVRVQWLLGCHGFTPDDGWLTRARAEVDELVLVDVEPEWALGEVLNALADRASAPVVTKMDDDDLYGPNYLADMLAVMRVSGAEVVGKHARWVHLAGKNLTVLAAPTMAWRPTNFVAGPTITALRDLAREVRFPALSRSEDTGFLKAAVEAGARVQAGDPFNFVQMRSAGGAGHTWGVEDEYFLRAERQEPGLPSGLVMV